MRILAAGADLYFFQDRNRERARAAAAADVVRAAVKA
jgi:hypothetical protein